MSYLIVFKVRCPFCGYVDQYAYGESWEDVWRYRCPVCDGRFYVVRPPPLRVRCPYCRSLLEAGLEGVVKVIERGEGRAELVPMTLTGALLGAVVGGLLDKDRRVLGALVGGLIGGIIGSLLEEKEAIYV